MQELILRAKALLEQGEVSRVLGWKKGETAWDAEPCFFETAESLENFVYDGFCGANLSKYMIEAGKKEGKTLVFLKPCDSYSFNQLLTEHRVDRDKAYIIGVGCKGKLNIEKIKKTGIKGVIAISGAEMTDACDTLAIDTIYGEKSCSYNDGMLERCHVCKGKAHMVCDEQIARIDAILARIEELKGRRNVEPNVPPAADPETTTDPITADETDFVIVEE